MAIVFKAPKSTLNTTSKQIQNVNGNCPPCPEPVLEGKELNYTQNGEYTVTPEQGVDGFSSIDVTVNVPSDVNNQDKTVSPSTSSQSVSADSGYTGLGTVTVNPVTSSIDANIQPENILSGVTILGVSGTDEGYDAGYTDGETAGHSAGYAEGEADGIVEGIAEQKAKLTTLNVSANGNYTREDGYDEVNVDVQPNLTVGTITQNGGYAPFGYDGYSRVEVNVLPKLETRGVTYTSNDTYTVTPDAAMDGLSRVTVTVNVPSDINNQNKTVNPSTSSQSISADSGYSGLGTVTVNAVTAAIDSNIQAENILSGITILGVEGTDEGYDAGYSAGEADGEQAGYDSGYQTGYDEGYAAGQEECPTTNLDSLDATITTNGTHHYDPIEPVDGFNSVDITVNVQPDLETKTATYVANNTYTITPTAGKDGISQATITVNVPSDIHNQNKTVSPSTSQQTVTADSGYSGLGTVTVNAVTAAIDANIVAQNILDGVTILGVTGSDMGYQTGYDTGYADGYNQGQSECPEPGGCDNTAYVQETITTNGTYVFDPTDYQGGSYDAFNGVEITVNVSGGTPVAPEPVTITSKGNGGVFVYQLQDQSYTAKSIQYSRDGGQTWNTGYNISLTLDEGQSVKLRGKNSDYLGMKVNVINVNFDISGDLVSLIDYEHPENVQIKPYGFDGFLYYSRVEDASGLRLTSIVPVGCYSNFFSGCTSLTSAPVLPAMQVGDFGYYGMFNSCTSLTSAPVLPATVLGRESYSNMFTNCTSLTTAPNLPAKFVPERCYQNMFSGCSLLTTAPVISAISFSGEENCSGMFGNCANLTTAPALLATTLTDHCYENMFAGCQSLTTAPALPSVDLGWSCYKSMFYWCSSLQTAPELPATILKYGCYQNMFDGCSNINEVTCLATTVDSGYTIADCISDWLNDVAASGTLYKNANSQLDFSSVVPSGWTITNAS